MLREMLLADMAAAAEQQISGAQWWAEQQHVTAFLRLAWKLCMHCVKAWLRYLVQRLQ